MMWCLPCLRRRPKPDPEPEPEPDDFLPTMRFREPCLRDAFTKPASLVLRDAPRLVLCDDDDRTVYVFTR